MEGERRRGAKAPKVQIAQGQPKKRVRPSHVLVDSIHWRARKLVKDRELDWSTALTGKRIFKIIDPGRNTLAQVLHMEIDNQLNEVVGARREWTFSNKQYQHEMGTQRHAEMREKHTERAIAAHPPLRAILDGYAQRTLKVSSTAAFDVALDFKHANYAQLFHLYSARKLRHANTESLMYKTRSTDKFINRLLAGGNRDQTCVVFGAAKFNTSSAGHPSGPLTSLARKISQSVDTVYLDEFRTSKIHHDCQAAMVVKKLPGVSRRTLVRTNRDPWKLRWCPTCRKFINRDSNACKNMGAVVLLSMRTRAYTRPPSLRRG